MGLVRKRNRYIDGFLAGQAVAYCEMVSRGVRLAGQLDVPSPRARGLRRIVEQEGCKALVRHGDGGRTALWIYREDAVGRLIEALEKAPMPSDVSVWSMGKVFGYADRDVLDFIIRPPT